MICKLHRRTTMLMLVAALMLLIASPGCQPSESTPAAQDGNATAQSSPASAIPRNAAGGARPEETVSAFLQALKMGDDARATSLLTAQAQREMERANAAIKPPGSPTAEFAVTEVQYLGEAKDGAHVLCSWTDTDTDGSRQSYEIVWMLRNEGGSWAIAGMATQVFEDQPPLVLNFEDPVDAQRKREAVDSEIVRRQSAPAAEQAQLPGSPDAAQR
jgi:limonene-1,2-epoxide hydrolase